MTEHDHSEEQEVDEAQLIEQFVMWVEMFVHDVESVPDEPTGRHWCPEWWQHPEVVARLKALYEAYIQADAENTMSAWWIQHWDPQARVLFSGAGPFKSCQRQHAFLERAEDYTPRLATVAPPAGWIP
ncbi:DUF4913 domain-containing protein [Paenarthrobacter ilicis]|uniref:DUF4913 domain-containing protein n=1 Tax=Paenarthrobacter ilicis TaxID=43665 RepID=UPI00386966FC